MTTLHTASFRAFRLGMGQPAAISLGLPRWLAEAEQWPRAWVLTPTPALFHLVSDEEFESAYLARLEQFGVRKIAATLERIAAEYDAERLVLCCFEANRERCHRSVFAAWWLFTTGERITEVP